MADLNQLKAERDDALKRAEQMLDAASNENRDLTRAEREDHAQAVEHIETLNRQIAQHELIERASQDPARVVQASAPNVNTRTAGKPWQVRDWHDADELRGRTEDALERMGVDDDAAARVLSVVESQAESHSERGDLARRIAATSDPAYERAFVKLLKSGGNATAFTTPEREAFERSMSVGVAADGGYAVPSSLDPSIILTNAGSSNALRRISRVVTVPVGNTWNGLSSAGVTASWDPELTEVSDDTPTLANPSIPLYMARQLVPYSIEASEDIPNLVAELARLFADAKDRLEETAYTTGAGSTEPKGVFTAVYAVTASRVTSTTAATIGVVDLQSVYKAVPQRARRNATWLMNPTYSMDIRALGTAVSASFSGDLTESPEGRIFGRPIVESDDAPSTQTTTALDSEILFGDFSQFVIADKMGMSVELIPHMFNTANNRPDGRRALWAHWRTGSDVVNADAWRLLVDKTTA